nr:MAG TPA: hypothetical protein [Crassvirales sp.]
MCLGTFVIIILLFDLLYLSIYRLVICLYVCL